MVGNCYHTIAVKVYVLEALFVLGICLYISGRYRTRNVGITNIVAR